MVLGVPAVGVSARTEAKGDNVPRILGSIDQMTWYLVVFARPADPMSVGEIER